MSEKLALIGFVPSDEIIADVVARQTPNVEIHGFGLFPNEAFRRASDTYTPLYTTDEEGDFQDTDFSKLNPTLASMGSLAINLGPDTAATMVGPHLRADKIDFIGASLEELGMEQDKSQIFEIFPEKAGILR